MSCRPGLSELGMAEETSRRPVMEWLCVSHRKTSLPADKPTLTSHHVVTCTFSLYFLQITQQVPANHTAELQNTHITNLQKPSQQFKNPLAPGKLLQTFKNQVLLQAPDMTLTEYVAHSHISIEILILMLWQCL